VLVWTAMEDGRNGLLDSTGGSSAILMREARNAAQFRNCLSSAGHVSSSKLGFSSKRGFHQ